MSFFPTWDAFCRRRLEGIESSDHGFKIIRATTTANGVRPIFFHHKEFDHGTPEYKLRALVFKASALFKRRYDLDGEIELTFDEIDINDLDSVMVLKIVGRLREQGWSIQERINNRLMAEQLYRSLASNLNHYWYFGELSIGECKDISAIKSIKLEGKS